MGEYLMILSKKLVNRLRAYFLSSVEREIELRKRSANADAVMKKLEFQDVVITREVFKDWLQDSDLVDMLEEMDIGTANKTELFDVLDCDLSGELEVTEV